MSDLSSHFNALYRNQSPFGKKPLEIIEHILEYKKNGVVLDLGAGDGRNSIFLAKNGFQVTSIDISNTAIEKLNDYSKEERLPLVTSVQDIAKFPFSSNYDVIIAVFVLHYFDVQTARTIIKNMQHHTKQNGLNIVVTFTAEGDFYRQNPATKNFYPEKGVLKTYYDDWTILEYSEENRRAFQKSKDGKPMTNATSFLLAENDK